ncbi:hypothetical protein [Aquihabitans sp. McL0605]|uniref:hypothetical protein n=1 Tax=Aquihabitans sp. McL0605 TaxID=3415671 RepID=UPI003CF1DF82
MTAVAIVAITSGFILLSGIVIVRQQVVQEGFYSRALRHDRVYERVYSQVLTDPELTALTEGLVGDLRLDGVDPADARVFTTNALHLVLPPSQLRQGVERLLAAVLAYVRGDTDRLSAVDVSSLLTNVRAAAVTFADSALSSARPETVATVAAYRASVRQVEAELAAGRIPDVVPLPAATLSVEDVVAVLDDAAGPDLSRADTVLIQAAVGASNPLEALIAAMKPQVEAAASTSATHLSDDLGHGRDFDVAGALAEHARTSSAQVTASLAVPRRAASWFGLPAAGAGVVLVLAGIAMLFAVHRGRRARATAVAVALLAAGVAINGLWLLGRHGIDPPLSPATTAGPGGWNLPTGLRLVVRDVEGTLADQLQHAVWRISVLPLVAGGAILVALVATRLARSGAVRIGAVAVAASGAIVLAVLVAAPGPRSERACNGHAELCDRPYDTVVQAATHNAMSSPDAVQIWPEQDLTIGEQLDLGIRTLLLDVHHWPRTTPADISRVVPGVSPAAARSIASLDAERFRPRKGVFLCHVLCALGGIPVGDGLAPIRTFLDRNPDEVVTLIVQDEVPRADVVHAFTDAGLAGYAYPHRRGEPWPTLGALIDQDRRLVVFAENSGSPPSWYQAAFDQISDTPFGFPRGAPMTCATNRGPDDSALFLVNHWVSGPAPDRAAALAVNQTDAIVERARRCAKERGQEPNFIAVDFAGLGGELEAVDILNGFGP